MKKLLKKFGNSTKTYIQDHKEGFTIIGLFTLGIGISLIEMDRINKRVEEQVSNGYLEMGNTKYKTLDGDFITVEQWDSKELS